MSSLEIIKQELINQKTLLENKGFSVTVTNINPSPTDISNAIDKIDINLFETDATEQDVRAGKKFISQTQGVRTGTLTTIEGDGSQNKLDQCVSGSGADDAGLQRALSADELRAEPEAGRLHAAVAANADRL